MATVGRAKRFRTGPTRLQQARRQSDGRSDEGCDPPAAGLPKTSAVAEALGIAFMAENL